MRRLRALVVNLPLDSAFARSLAGESAEWRNTEELLATLIEVTDHGNRLFVQAHSKSPAPPAIEIPRPYKRAQEQQQRTMTTAEIEAMHPELFVEMN